MFWWKPKPANVSELVLSVEKRWRIKFAHVVQLVLLVKTALARPKTLS